jgi:hypothetical protein
MVAAGAGPMVREGGVAIAADAGPDGALIGVPFVFVRPAHPGAVGGVVAVRPLRLGRGAEQQQNQEWAHRAMLHGRPFFAPRRLALCYCSPARSLTWERGLKLPEDGL